MKTFSLSLVALLMALSLVSCRKEYTCSCTFPNAELNVSESYKDLRKWEAEDLCESSDKVAALTGGSCRLK